MIHDFAVISLSDLLTPWETIEKRIEMAAQGDFVTALYNPKSKKRVENIERVREIMLQHRKADTPVGIVTAASREGEGKIISTLEDFTKQEINMFSLVIIGNSMTYVKDGYMIRPAVMAIRSRAYDFRAGRHAGRPGNRQTIVGEWL